MDGWPPTHPSIHRVSSWVVVVVVVVVVVTLVVLVWMDGWMDRWTAIQLPPPPPTTTKPPLPLGLRLYDYTVILLYDCMNVVGVEYNFIVFTKAVGEYIFVVFTIFSDHLTPKIPCELFSVPNRNRKTVLFRSAVAEIPVPHGRHF